MKRTISLLLTVLLCLCGCSAPPVNTAEEETLLAELLTQIDNTMQPGTAGSSLTAAFLAATMLDWSRSTTLDRETVTQITETAIETARTDHPMTFAEKMQSIYSAYERLMTTEGEGLLSDCGYTGDGYPWTAEDAAALQWVFETVNAS